jgi:glyoxylase-like metal-dependent hydrolase (beta-lactamase superfamily II)
MSGPGEEKRMSEHYQHYEPFHMTVHTRSLPYPLKPGIWMWSAFNEEKALHFNGYLLETAAHTGVIVDPVLDELDPQAVLNAFAPLPKPTAIWLTNRDHERASSRFSKHFGIPVFSHEADANLFEIKPDRTFKDGEVLDGGWQVIHLENQKSPGESVFYHADRRLLLLGDAMIGKPTGYLCMLPDEKYADKAKAKEGLARLRELAVETVLVCDGDPITNAAQGLLRDVLRD